MLQNKASPESFIKVIDNALPFATVESIFHTIIRLPFYYGERDSADKPPTGLSSNLNLDHWVVKTIEQTALEEISSLRLYRSYVNIFVPGEKLFFHTDHDQGLTVLFYPNLEYDIEQGGETSFLIDGKITGIIPKPGRVVIFSANLIHKANSFRDQHRFSIALKYI